MRSNSLVSSPRSLLIHPPPTSALSPQPVSSESSPTRSEYSSSTEYTYTPPSRSSSSDGSHSYRGITFNDILSPHMITTAPPPDADAKGEQKRRHPKAKAASASVAERPSPSRLHSAPPSSWSTMKVERPRSPPSKRNYPTSEKKLLSGGGGGKSRMRATARAIFRGLSVVNVKRDSRGRRGFEAI